MITPRRLTTVVGLLGLALLLVMALALGLGPVRLAPHEIVTVLTGQSEDSGSLAPTVILRLRLPRILLAVLAGGGLAVAGATFQALTRNPLADPSLLGVSSGAAFGVVVAQVMGVGPTPLGVLGLSAFAFAGAVVAAVAVYLIARVGTLLPIQTLLLSGVIVGLFFSSAITLLISFIDFSKLGGVLHWLMGNLEPVGYSSLAILAVGLGLGVGIVFAQARALNLLAMGEESALQLGVESERVKRRVFLAASLLTALVVTFAGPIGFVGLIIPHVARLLFGPDNRLLIPAAVLVGGGFLVLADGLSRTLIQPAELPVGVVTAFCGAPFFIYLMRSRFRKGL